MLQYLNFIITQSSILVGGQAVIEGVLMRVPGAYATAVRSPNGEILIDNINCSKISLESLRSMISIVPQDSFLFNDTIKNNIAFGKLDAGLDEIQMAAKKANANEFISNLPQLYDTSIGERGVKLSGGQRQRISIARAILKNSSRAINEIPRSS